MGLYSASGFLSSVYPVIFFSFLWQFPSPVSNSSRTVSTNGLYDIDTLDTFGHNTMYTYQSLYTLVHRPIVDNIHLIKWLINHNCPYFGPVYSGAITSVTVMYMCTCTVCRLKEQILGSCVPLLQHWGASPCCPPVLTSLHWTQFTGLGQSVLHVDHCIGILENEQRIEKIS